MSADDPVADDPVPDAPPAGARSDPWSLALRAGMLAGGRPDEATTGRGTRYRLGAELGRGGLAVVYRGEDADLGREVAVKVLKPELAARPDVLRRFVEEARVGAQLQHPGVVPVHEMGLLPAGQPFIVMKLVEGRTLADLLEAEGAEPLGPRRRLVLFEALAQTLAYAHARGVVHRDVKPANVMLGAFGEVQLLDWGLAKVMARPGEPPATMDPGAVPAGASLAGTVVGTPGHMSPEQARGDTAATTPASDVFALGSLLCRLLTGAPAFVGGTEDVLARTRVGDLAEAGRRLDACGADPELVDLARRCLAPEPGARPADAAHVAATIGGHLARADERAEAARLQAVRAEVEAASERRRRRLVVALGSLAAVVVVGAAATWVLVERARTGRAERTRGVVEAAERESADATGKGDLLQAVASARRALVLAEGPDGTAELASRARARLAAAERSEAAAREKDERERKDRALAARVEDAQLRTLEQVEPREVREAFADAFRRDGLDVDAASDDAVVAHLKDRGVTVQAATALDDWARVLEGAEAERRIALADRLDPDPLRLELRRSGDRARLEELARGDAATLTPVTVERLLKRLQDLRAVDAALPLARRAVELWPADAALVIRIAALQEERRPRDLAEELRWATVATGLRPRSPAAWTTLAAALEAVGPERWPEAEAALRRAVELDTGTGGALLELGEHLRDVGRFDESLEALRRAEALGPEGLKADLRVQRALTFQSLGRMREAIAEAEAAVAAMPASAWAHHVLGMLLVNANEDFAAGRRHFETAERLAPTSVVARHARGMLATVELNSGDAAGALAKFRALLVDGPNDDWPLYGASRCEYVLGRFDEALATVRRARSLEPASARYLQHEGDVLTALRRFDEARQTYEEARRRAPGDAMTELGYARALLGAADYAKAEEVLRAVVTRVPTSLEGLSLSNAQEGLGKHPEAVASVRAALALKPDDPVILRNLAVQLELARDHEGALAAITRAIELSPADADLRVVRATRTWMSIGRAAAIADLREAARLDPDSANAWRNLGIQLTATGEFLEAERVLREARARLVNEKLPDRRTLLLFRHARVLFLLGRPEDARATLVEGLLANAPGETAARKDLAEVLVELRDFGAARREIESAWKDDPREESVRGDLRRLTATLDALEPARDALLADEPSQTSDAAALLAEAQWLRLQGAFPRAAARYGDAFAVGPTLAAAHRFDALRAAARALASGTGPLPADAEARLVRWLEDELEAEDAALEKASGEARWAARRTLARVLMHDDLVPLSREDLKARLTPASRARVEAALARARAAFEASAPR